MGREEARTEPGACPQTCHAFKHIRTVSADREGKLRGVCGQGSSGAGGTCLRALRLHWHCYYYVLHVLPPVSVSKSKPISSSQAVLCGLTYTSASLL